MIHFFALGGFDAQVDQRQLDVLVDVQFVDQVETLENETDFAFAVQRAIFFLQGSDFLSEQVVFARGRVVQQPEDVQQRRFAATGRPHDRNEFAFGDFERNLVQSDGFDLFRTEALAQFFNFQHSSNF